MKYITEEYGQPCELIESTCEEFFIMKEFLKQHGVEARLVMSYGEVCKWQIRNVYKYWCFGTINGSEIAKRAEKEIESGNWCR